MSDYFQERFDKHPVHENLRNTIRTIENLLGNYNSAQAEAILQELLRMLIILQNAIANMNPADTLQTNVLRQINIIVNTNNEKFEYYKVNGNINDLIEIRDEKYHFLTFYLNIISDEGNENILNSLEEVFKLTPRIELIKPENNSDNIDFSAKFKEQEEKLKKLSDMTKGKINEVDKELGETINDFTDKISKYDTEAKGEHEKLKKLHGIVASAGFAGSYSKIFAVEENYADNWRSCSVACIVCIILAALHATSLPIEQEKSLVFIGQFIKTFSVAAAFIYGAVFSIRQSNQHRKNANKAKWLATGINAIESFTGTLDEDKRSEVRLKMIEIILSQEEDGDSAESSAGQGDIMEQLRAMTDLIKAKS